MNEQANSKRSAGPILLVDDTAQVRILVRKVLEPIGREVIEARSGSEALVILRSRADIELVLLDVVMPVMDGIETLKKIRAGGNEVPVAMLTSTSGLQLVSQALSMGVRAYIKKPFEKEVLRSKVKELLGEEEPREVSCVEEVDNEEGLLSTAGLNILIVDSQVQNAVFLEELLELDSHRVSVVRTFDEAIQVGSTMRLNLILVNLLYPEITKPTELNSYRKELSVGSSLRIIGYFSDPPPGPVDLGSQFQPTGYLDGVCPNPFSLAQLREIIEASRMGAVELDSQGEMIER